MLRNNLNKILNRFQIRNTKQDIRFKIRHVDFIINDDINCVEYDRYVVS